MDGTEDAVELDSEHPARWVEKTKHLLTLLPAVLDELERAGIHPARTRRPSPADPNVD